ncbi:MAG: ATP-binding protein [Chloroflexota bacterium]
MDETEPTDPGAPNESETISDNVPILTRPPVPLDADLSEERLRHLLALGTEYDELEFKRTYDLRNRQDELEFARTVVSMANTHGGYLVLGVAHDRRSQPTLQIVGCPEDHLVGFDPTAIREKLAKYVDEPVDAGLRIHRLASHEHRPVVMVFVPPTRTLPLTFRIQGNLHDGATGQRAQFRPGDVWVRRNAACTLANAGDWRRIRSAIRNAEREKWTEDLLGVAPLVQRMDRIATLLERVLELGGIQVPPRPGAPPLSASDYLLPPEQLAERLAQLRETHDT